MVLTARLAIAVLLLSTLPAVAEEPPRPLEVRLPVKDYLALVEKAEAAEKERKRREAAREAPIAEVTSQRVRVVLGEKGTAEITTDYEVLVQGEPKGPVALPATGVPRKAEVRSGPADAALTVGPTPWQWLLVAPTPGRYAVEIAGLVPFGGGVSQIDLAPAVAPVALTEVELPADLAWSAPGAVVVDDRVAGARRTVRLTSCRGAAQTLEVRRKVEGGDADRLLVQSLVLTLIQLLPDGPRRHDVVIYEVVRGGLGSFTVDLPPGLAAETVGTDEGEVVPAVEARRLTVQRRQQLRGVGYLVITSTPKPGEELALAPVVPQGTVRGRFVALSSAIAAEARPVPEAAWSRVDLDDLPPALREALAGIDLAAAWRRARPAEGARMDVTPLPAAPVLPAVAGRRETTTLITLDGTLLHRDRITLRPGALGAALDVVLPAGATLWSAKVDEVAVRPLERGNGAISVPLGFDTGRDAVVEVVSVQEKAVPKGRSELALELPRVAVPVREHQWRLLLPDGASYRYRGGELRPAAAPSPKARQDAVAESAAAMPQANAPAAPAYYDFDAFEEMKTTLRQGLVGGVKPLPVTIPETGKLLLLSGVLPPERIGVEIEVKGRK